MTEEKDTGPLFQGQGVQELARQKERESAQKEEVRTETPENEEQRRFNLAEELAILKQAGDRAGYIAAMYNSMSIEDLEKEVDSARREAATRWKAANQAEHPRDTTLTPPATAAPVPTTHTGLRYLPKDQVAEALESELREMSLEEILNRKHRWGIPFGVNRRTVKRTLPKGAG